MKFRQITPFIIIMIFVAVLLQVGCDTLVTENNTIVLIDTTLGVSCIDCHSDEDNLLLRPRGQFANSAHANHSLLDVTVDVSGVSCKKCHTHEGFLKEVDGSITTNPKSYSAITCYTCHLPHTGEYDTWKIDTLRASDKIVILASGFGGNLGATEYSPSNSCIHCHSAVKGVSGASTIVLDSTFDTHVSSQTDILTGKNAYFIDSTAGFTEQHRLNGCVKCHYGGEGVGQGYTFAEHTFRLEDKNTSTQYVKTCNVTGCHLGATPIEDFYDRPSIHAIDSLSNVVKSLLASFEIIDSTDTSGLTFTIGDTISSTQAQAYYNYLIYKNDGSQGIHNPKFVNALLSSTAYVLDSLPATATFTVDNPVNCFGTPFTFTPEVRGAFDTLIWRFGDNTSTTSFDLSPVVKTYSSRGSYSIQLITASLWNDKNNVQKVSYDTTLVVDYIVVDSTPTADFALEDAADSVICAGTPVVFANNSSHFAPGMYIWDFGDGSVDTISTDTTIATFSKTYNSIGTFDVSLELITDCGADTASYAGIVRTIGAAPIITTDSTNAGTFEFTFISNTQGTIDSLTWDYDGDNVVDSTSTDINNSITVQYTQTGATQVFLVTLKVYNATCNVSSTQETIIIPPISVK